MSKLFQIYEEDLQELERVLPDLTERLAAHLTARQRTQIHRVQTILSNVRWNYGPPREVHRIDCGDEGDGHPSE